MDIIQNHKKISFVHLLEKSQIGKMFWLMNSNYHGGRIWAGLLKNKSNKIFTITKSSCPVRLNQNFRKKICYAKFLS